jgi:hypothetical protein
MLYGPDFAPAYQAERGPTWKPPFRSVALCQPANARHLVVVNDDVPTAKLSIYCLVNGVGFSICAFPYLDGELVRLSSCFIAILGENSEGIETLAIDGPFTLELGTNVADYQPGNLFAFQVDITDVILELQVASRSIVLVFDHEAIVVSLD